MSEIKEQLLDAVPPLPAPPDRLAAIRGRVTARRRMHRTGTAVAALASVVALGTTMAVLTPAGSGTPVGGPDSSGTPSPWASRSGVPAPYRSGEPKDFPMPAAGVCPPSVDFMRMPMVEAYPGGVLPQIAGVTLCRYTQSAFDLSKGENSLTSGPKTGDVNTFLNAFVVATTPIASSPPPSVAVSSSASEPLSCQPSSPPFTVDVVFVHSSDGTTRAELQHRYLCVPGQTDSFSPLRAAIDAELGPPY